MPTIIACLIAGICAAGFVTIWFTTVNQKLSLKRNILSDLQEQRRMHERLAFEAKDGPDARVAAGMFETSQMLCREAAKSYNCLLRKPMNYIPALIMGFRPATEN